MSVDASSWRAEAKIACSQTRTNGNFASAKAANDGVSFSLSPSATTYQQALIAEYTILAAGTQTVDLSSFTTLLFQAVTTANKVLGFIVKATGDTGVLKIEPGASNPLTWFFGGTTPSISLECGASGCCLMLMDGVAETVDGTHKTILLTNTGAATITVSLEIIVGTS
jgi:hypothetical protein